VVSPTPTEGLQYEPLQKVSDDLSTMEVDVDSDMEEIPVILPMASSVVPRTMQEMAESAARQREEVKSGASGNVEVTDIDIQRRSGPESTPGSEGTPKTRATHPSKANSSKPAVSKKPGTRPRVTRRASARKRERDSGTDEDTDEDVSENLSPPKKRTRVAASSSTPAPPTRTLRPRASKTPAQIREEKEQEAAFRRATAS
jgi:xeroderma pigmentosum group C-complementing protein